MSKCTHCDKDMLKTDSCSFNSVVHDNGKVYKRKHECLAKEITKCHDCNMTPADGHSHHFGCDNEICPICKGQIICCDCKWSKLANK